MGKKSAVEQKVDLLEKELRENTKLINSLRLGQQILINREKVAESDDFRLDRILEAPDKKSIKKKIEKISYALQNTPDLLSAFKEILYEKDIEMEKMTDMLYAYRARLKNQDMMKNQLTELKYSVNHFRDQFNSLKEEIKKKSDAIFSSESEIAKMQHMLDNAKRYNGLLVKHIIEQDNMIKNLRVEKKKYLNEFENRNLMKKKVLEHIIEINNLKKREQALKDLLGRKNDIIIEHSDNLKDKDQKLKILNNHQERIRLGIKASDDANSSLIKKIETLESKVKELKARSENFDKEKKSLENHYKMLLALNEKSTQKRLREMAEAESKKEIVLNMRISELKNMINKQKSVIDQRTDFLKNLASFASDKITNLDMLGPDIDYRTLEEKQDNYKINFKHADQKKESISSDSKDITSEVKNALDDGQPEDVIRTMMAEKGYDSAVISQVLEEQKKKLGSAN
ncbi:MAG: hypothetical protein ACLFPQ_03270 [Candidatus Woesearchaeota archaeon]